MCGLTATVSFDGQRADPVLLKRAADTLIHRGPDDEGFATFGQVGFAFRRLAILDLSMAGHQPMQSSDGRLAIIFNGEIYNYIELKRELEQLGHRFQSAGDTEVLLHAYDEWGVDCVTRCNGMWAFVIYDLQKRRLLASRDRFGVKPLYRYSDGRRLILASEIKAILSSGWYDPDVNWQTAARFLCRGHLDEDTTTLYRGITQLAPGSTLEIDLDGRMQERRFWSIGSITGETPRDPVATFRELFEDAVRLRMRSDVPVGVCLSGGIDSNAIISMMAKLRPADAAAPLQAFSYIPDEFSEAEYINESIAKTGATLNVLQTSPQQLWDTLPTALWHYDEPVHSPTALIAFQLMRLAKSRGVTVVLNGQGADEVNAGYHTFFRPYWTDLLRTGRWRRAATEMGAYSSAQGQAYWPLVRQTTAHWLRTELRRIPGYQLVRGTQRTGDSTPTAGWYGAELRRELDPLDVSIWAGSLSESLAYSVEHRPLPLYLRVEDRNSMAHSVEVRLPFLDYRLAELAFSLSGEWKLRGPWNKFIVREAMKGVIAERVRTRLDKMGFPTPGKSWFAGPWYGPTRDVLSSKALRESGWCDVDAALQDLDAHRDERTDASSQLFHLAQFGVWMERFGRRSPTTSHEPLVVASSVPEHQSA